MERVPISAVLVSKDNLDDVVNTLESLKSLIVYNIEIVIIDSSKDNQIKDFVSLGAHKNIAYSHMKPSGIYSAMNLGVKYCTPGNYIWFLNPGDILSNPQSLMSLLAGGISENFPWIYAQAGIVSTPPSRNFPTLSDEHTFSALNQGFLRISHQAMLVRTDVFHKLNGFDLRYKICSDFDFQVRLFESFPGYFQELSIAHIDPNGLSHQRIFTTYFETFLIRVRSGNMRFVDAAFLTIKNLVLLIIKKLVRILNG
jgi:GT2 family glycosyltransferase